MCESFWQDKYGSIHFHAKGQRFVEALALFADEIHLQRIDESETCRSLSAPSNGIAVSYSDGCGGFFLTDTRSTDLPKRFAFEACISNDTNLNEACKGLIAGLLTPGLICRDLVDLLCHFKNSPQPSVYIYPADDEPPVLPAQTPRFFIAMCPNNSEAISKFTLPAFTEITRRLSPAQDEPVDGKDYINDTLTGTALRVLLLHL